jgi:hypothetical protein
MVVSRSMAFARRSAFASVCSCLVLAAAQASPYRITGLDAADHWEIKMIAKDTVEGDERVREAPLIDLTAPLAPGLETSVTFGRGRLHVEGESARSGAVDTELAVKWEMVPMGADGTIGVTVEPALIAPTGSAGLSDDIWSAEVPLVIGWNRGSLRLRGLVGYGRSLEDDDDEISVGGLVEYKVLSELSLGLEVMNTMPSDDPDQRWKSMVDVGFKYELSSTVELQGRLSRSARTAGDPRVTQIAIYLEIAL